LYAQFVISFAHNALRTFSEISVGTPAAINARATLEEFLEKVQDFRFVVLKPVTRALDPCLRRSQDASSRRRWPGRAESFR
jgi:hypothetical protein